MWFLGQQIRNLSKNMRHKRIFGAQYRGGSYTLNVLVDRYHVLLFANSEPHQNRQIHGRIPKLINSTTPGELGLAAYVDPDPRPTSDQNLMVNASFALAQSDRVRILFLNLTSNSEYTENSRSRRVDPVYIQYVGDLWADSRTFRPTILNIPHGPTSMTQNFASMNLRSDST